MPRRRTTTPASTTSPGTSRSPSDREARDHAAEGTPAAPHDEERADPRLPAEPAAPTRAKRREDQEPEAGTQRAPADGAQPDELGGEPECTVPGQDRSRVERPGARPARRDPRKEHPAGEGEAERPDDSHGGDELLEHQVDADREEPDPDPEAEPAGFGLSQRPAHRAGGRAPRPRAALVVGRSAGWSGGSRPAATGWRGRVNDVALEGAETPVEVVVGRSGAGHVGSLAQPASDRGSVAVGE